jgi:hypothetical protein
VKLLKNKLISMPVLAYSVQHRYNSAGIQVINTFPRFFSQPDLIYNTLCPSQRIGYENHFPLLVLQCTTYSRTSQENRRAALDPCPPFSVACLAITEKKYIFAAIRFE